MYSKLIIVGNVGREPEMRYTPAGVPVTSFTVAVNRQWTNAAGEKAEKTTWYRITCWRKLAEIAAQYIRKGRLLLVEGEIEASAFTDKEGTAHATLELTAATFKLLGGRRDGDNESDGESNSVPEIGGEDNSIPF